MRFVSHPTGMILPLENDWGIFLDIAGDPTLTQEETPYGTRYYADVATAMVINPRGDIVQKLEGVTPPVLMDLIDGVVLFPSVVPPPTQEAIPASSEELPPGVLRFRKR